MTCTHLHLASTFPLNLQHAKCSKQGLSHKVNFSFNHTGPHSSVIYIYVVLTWTQLFHLSHGGAAGCNNRVFADAGVSAAVLAAANICCENLH